MSTNPQPITLRINVDSQAAVQGLEAVSDAVETVATETTEATNTIGGLQRRIEQLRQEIESEPLGTARFKELQRELATTQGKFKDVEKAFEGLDAEQRATAIADQVSGIGGAAGAAAGAVALFGDENSEAAKRLVELQGALAVIGGLTAFAQAAAKSGQAAKVLGLSFNSALGPAGLLLGAVAAVGAAFAAFSLSSDSAAKTSKAYAAAANEAAAAAAQEKVELNLTLDAIKNTATSQAERVKLVDDLVSKYPEYLGQQEREALLLGDTAAATEKLNKVLVAKLRLQASEAVVVQATERQIKAQLELEAAARKAGVSFEELLAVAEQISGLIDITKDYRKATEEVAEAQDFLAGIVAESNEASLRTGKTVAAAQAEAAERDKKAAAAAAAAAERQKQLEAQRAAAQAAAEVAAQKEAELFQLTTEFAVEQTRLAREAEAAAIDFGEAQEDAGESIVQQALAGEAARAAEARALENARAGLAAYSAEIQATREAEAQQAAARRQQIAQTVQATLEIADATASAIGAVFELLNQQTAQQLAELDERREILDERIAATNELVAESEGRLAELTDRLATATADQRSEIVEALQAERAQLRANQAEAAKAAAQKQQLDQQAKQLQLEQFRRDKALRIGQIGLDTARAIIAALASGVPLPGIPLSIAAGVTGAAQLAAAIAQQPGFAAGGFTGHGPTNAVAGIVHAGEYVVPAKLMASPDLKPVINMLEARRLRGYQDGGIVSPATATQRASAMATAMASERPIIVEVSAIDRATTQVRRAEARASL